MKVKIYVEEKFKTLLTRKAVEINTEDYPELVGMDDYELEEYIDDHIWDMKPLNDVYSSLGEQVQQSDIFDEDTFDVQSTYYIETI
jgi:hypothetical protein